MVVLVSTFAYIGVLIQTENFALDFVLQSRAQKTKFTVKSPQMLKDAHNRLPAKLKNLMRIPISVQFNNALYCV
jgi:hypothetical protein